MKAFFNPQSIAVAGASNDHQKVGGLVMRRLAADYAGRLFPLNPHEDEIAGHRVYPGPAALPEPVDLLVALLPGENLLPLVEACPEGRVGYLLAVPAGFGEASPTGRETQDRIVEAARARGMRVIGPNCMGMVNAALGLNASLVPYRAPGGPGLSCLTQSGGFGIATTMYAIDHQMPVAKVCDLGNTSDVQVHEVLRHLADDPETRVIGLFLEAVRDADAFVAAAAEAVSRKPVVLTGLGRTPAGRRSSTAHLGLEPDIDVAALCARTGMVPARTGRDLLDVAKGLVGQPIPRGRRVGIITATGGVAAELADLCVEHGLEVPPFSEPLQRAMRPLAPPYATFANPIDVSPIWWQFAEIYPRMIRSLLDSDEVDLLIVSVTDVPTGIDAFAVALRDALKDAPAAAGKPAYVFWGSRDDMLANMHVIERAGIPCYRTTFDLVRAAAAIARA